MMEPNRTVPEDGCESFKNLTVYSGSRYEVVLKGQLDEYLVGWFDGMNITYDGCGLTTLSGYIADQSALHGVLSQIRDLNLILVSLKCLGSSAER